MPLVRLRLFAGALGVAVGIIGRNVPIAVASAALHPTRANSCGMEGVFECIARDSGTVFVEVARLAVTTVALSGAAAVLGVVALVIGLVSKHRVASPLLVGAGSSLTVPALWLVGSFLASATG